VYFYEHLLACQQTGLVGPQIYLFIQLVADFRYLYVIHKIKRDHIISIYMRIPEIENITTEKYKDKELARLVNVIIDNERINTLAAGDSYT
jgi:hypothetical protein